MELDEGEVLRAVREEGPIDLLSLRARLVRGRLGPELTPEALGMAGRIDLPLRGLVWRLVGEGLLDFDSLRRVVPARPAAKGK